MIDSRTEAARMRAIYEARGYDGDTAYSDIDPVYLQRVQSMERALLRGLSVAGLSARIPLLDVLDFGCGNGRWFGRWLAWGAAAERLLGVDVRPEAVARARAGFPTCRFQETDPALLPFADGSFDVVSQHLAFSSILDAELRVAAAAEMARVLRPRGVLLWCDMSVQNPNNANVRSVPRRELLGLFPQLEALRVERLVLAPPLARRLAPRARLLVEILESVVPPLCTHLYATFRKS
jgi:SAM-dependent methyltransferase